jgi:hypothetical protein
MRYAGLCENGVAAQGWPSRHFFRNGIPILHGVRLQGVRPHRRIRSSGTEYVSEYGMKWMSGGTKRRCDRARAGASRISPASAAAPICAQRKHPKPWSWNCGTVELWNCEEWDPELGISRTAFGVMEGHTGSLG